MDDSFRFEKDQVEKAQQEAAQRLQLESRLAQAKPATTDKSTEQLQLLEDKSLRQFKAELPEAAAKAEQVSAEAHLCKTTQPLWQLERDSPAYRARVEQFRKDFAGKPGVGDIVEHALGDNFIYRTGAAHQIDVAYKIGPDRVRCFEDPIALGDKHAVDIVTTDSVAIECKAATGEAISGSSVYKGIRQGEIYLDSDKYRAAIVVCPDDTLREAGQKAVLGREFHSEVRVCQLGDLEKALRQADQLKLRA